MAMGRANQQVELGHVAADLVILTVLPEEYAAVRSCLDDVALLRGSHEIPNTYSWELGTIPSSSYGAPFSVVVGKGTQTPSYGALAAKQAIQLFSPSYVVFVGIGGGFARDGQQHGDVAVSSVVTSYEYGKVGAGGFSPRRDFTYRCDEGLIRNADALIAADTTGWWRTSDNPDRAPRARSGVIASGDKVIDNPDDAFFAGVLEAWPTILAVEMEGAGVAAAIHEAQAERKAVGFVLVRGISDMPGAGPARDEASTMERDRWKPTAAHNAARFLRHLVETRWPIPPSRRTAVIADSSIDPPGLWGELCDHLFPRLHNRLRRIGAVRKPAEYDDITGYMRSLRTSIKRDIKRKTQARDTYVPVHAQSVPRVPRAEGDNDDKFVRPIHQVIRVIQGLAEGGDSASADLALVNRQSSVVKNLARKLRRTHQPLMLLGDPGTGKSMTLQQVACAMIDSELRRVFPTLTLFVPLGEFHRPTPVGSEDVLDYVRHRLPEHVARWLDALDQAGRLVILFDAMDEMSRERYTEHTEALSDFASSREWQTKTLFSCRITDFSPRFVHQRLVLVPFDRRQILTYLRDYFRPSREIPIKEERWPFEEKPWPLPRLAKRLAQRSLPFDARNPFVLWLLCHHLDSKRQWPASRVELLDSLLEETFRRKQEEREPSLAGLNQADCEAALAEFAFIITTRNLGRAISVIDLTASASRREVVPRMIPAGRTLGVLAQSKDLLEYEVQFEHHRLQEYFTARHLCTAETGVQWRDKVDVPRWQETLVNLVLMGHGDSALQVLAASIEEAIEASLPVKSGGRDEDMRAASHWAPRTSTPEQLRKVIEASLAADVEDEAQERTSPAEGAPFVDGGSRGASQAGAPAAPQAKETPAPAPAQEQEPEPRLSASDEILLGDRVELAARIAREAAASSPAKQVLMPMLRRSVDFLTKHGNPVTQVKMMRACVRLPDAELLAAARRPMNSNVNWVRAQALVVLAEGERGLGLNLASEIGFDLARGELLPRIPSFIQAIASSRQAGAVRSLLLGVLAAALQLAMFIGVGAGIYWGVHHPAVAEAFPWLVLPDADWRIFGATMIAISVVAVLVRRAKYLGIILITATLQLLIIEYLVLANTRGEPIGMEWLLSSLCIAFLSPQMVILHFGATVPGFALYFATTRGPRSPDASSSLKSAFGVSGAQANYLWAAILAGLQGLTLLAGIDPPVAWLIAKYGFIILFYGGMVVYAIYAGIQYLRDARREGKKFWHLIHALLKQLLQAVASLKQLPHSAVETFRGWWWMAPVMIATIVAIAIIGWILENYYVVDWALIKWLVLRFVSLLGWAVVIAWTIFFAVTFIRTARWLYVSLRRRIFPPRSYTPERWKEIIRSQSPARQAETIVRTDHQSLGITAQAFYEVLAEIAGVVRAEPALSVYWQHRAELEQVLKQERRG